MYYSHLYVSYYDIMWKRPVSLISQFRIKLFTYSYHSFHRFLVDTWHPHWSKKLRRSHNFFVLFVFLKSALLASYLI